MPRAACYTSPEHVNTLMIFRDPTASVAPPDDADQTAPCPAWEGPPSSDSPVVIDLADEDLEED